MSAIEPIIPDTNTLVAIPLHKLKTSPRNARRMPHTSAAIEALAASIAAKTMLQAPVVEPELDDEGNPTGCYFVTIGEGRRRAQLLRVKRKEIKRSEPILCRVDTTHDPHEISLDENVTRSPMHPADQFEAFKRLAEERGLGAEEIAARFGVSAHVVRQRLRLGALSPRIIAAYRGGDLTLDQIMAYAITDDHARQEQALEGLSSNAGTYLIRRTLTEAKVPASDRRACFVGIEPYVEAGGTVSRDLFHDDEGGWLDDPVLLNQLALAKLEGLADELREQGAWKWAECSFEFRHGHGMRHIPRERTVRSDEEIARIIALGHERADLIDRLEGEEPSEEIILRLYAVASLGACSS